MVTIEEAIRHYKHGISHDIFSEPVISYAKLSIEALEKQIPKKPVHVHEVYPKHDWIRDEDGEIDMWVMDVGFHNGPGCKRCGASVCEHCNPDYDEEECEVDEMLCPTCSEKIGWPYEKNKFCPNCGQALDWSK